MKHQSFELSLRRFFDHKLRQSSPFVVKFLSMLVTSSVAQLVAHERDSLVHSRGDEGLQVDAQASSMWRAVEGTCRPDVISRRCCIEGGVVRSMRRRTPRAMRCRSRPQSVAADVENSRKSAMKVSRFGRLRPASAVRTRKARAPVKAAESSHAWRGLTSCWCLL